MPTDAPQAATTERVEDDLTRPIIGIANRSAQEAFDIMADRIRGATRGGRLSTPAEVDDLRARLAAAMRDVGWLREALERNAVLIEAQSDCLDHYAEQSGHPAKPVPSVFHLQSSHFRDIAKMMRFALAQIAPSTTPVVKTAPASGVTQAAADGGGEDFQQRVQPWLMACFGEMIAGDREERNHRFLEEALELVQSCGCSASEAHQLVDYVYGRPVGDPPQEVGGVMVTLAALCLANDLKMHEAAETELARIWTKVETIRAKQAAKPKHSPLRAALTPTPSPAEPPREVTREMIRSALSPALSSNHKWPREWVEGQIDRATNAVLALFQGERR